MTYFATGNTEDCRKFDGELRMENDVGEGRCLEHNVYVCRQKITTGRYSVTISCQKCWTRLRGRGLLRYYLNRTPSIKYMNLKQKLYHSLEITKRII
jgi:hypothetical protein